MKLLVTICAVFGLAVGLVAWRIVSSAGGAEPPRHRAAPAVPPPTHSYQPAPADLAEPALPASAPAETHVQVEQTAPQAAQQHAAVTASPAPAESQPAVRWAVDPRQRDAQRRLAAARQALAQNPYHPTALADELNALRVLRRWPEVADTLARMVELEPENTARRFEYAELLVRQQRWSAALPVLSAVVEREPEHAQAWYFLAAGRQALGHLHDARQGWNRVLELRPNDVDARGLRAEVLLALHEWNAAAADFEHVLAQDPARVSAALGRATALLKLGEEEPARRCVLSVLEHHPANVPAMNRLAQMAWQAYRTDPVGSHQRLDEVVAWCRRALEIDPRQPQTQALLDAARRAQEK